MLPSRPTLISWNPESLAPAATSIQSAGESIYRTVRQLDDGCDRMDGARTWSGKAHDAATEMFRRASDRSSQFFDSTKAVAKALSNGSASIGMTRTYLLREADAIDKTELSVNDQLGGADQAGGNDGRACRRSAEASRCCARRDQPAAARGR